MPTDMLDLTRVTFVGGSPSIATWPITSEITEFAIRPGTLHVRHTKEGAWPDVPYETTTQEATVYVFLQINGIWYGTGAERLRPNQQNKPEPLDVGDWLREWLYSDVWHPMTRYTPTPGEIVGVAIAAGNERVADVAPVQERTPTYLLAWPEPNGREYPPWATAAASTPVPPTPPGPSADLELAARLDVIETELREIKALLQQPPAYRASAQLPGWLGGKTSIVATPVPRDGQ